MKVRAYMLDTLFVSLLTDFHAWHILLLHDMMTQHADGMESQIDSLAVTEVYHSEMNILYNLP